MFGFFQRPSPTELPPCFVRPAQESDQSAILTLLGRRFGDIGLSLDTAGDDKDLTDIDYYWRRPGGEFMTLWHFDKLIGTLAAHPLPEAGKAEFDWFYMDPAYEGLGYSTALYAWALGWCVAKGVHTIELWTGQSRTGAHSIYRKLGFVHHGVTRLVRRDPDYHLLYFELSLTPERIAEMQKRFSSAIQ